MKYKLYPKKNRVLIEKEGQQEETKSGIMIPDSAKERVYKAKIISIGPDVNVEQLKPGDLVVFAKYAGTEVSFGEGGMECKFFLIKEDDIIATYEEIEDDPNK